jgi:hypothetical protein
MLCTCLISDVHTCIQQFPKSDLKLPLVISNCTNNISFTVKNVLQIEIICVIFIALPNLVTLISISKLMSNAPGVSSSFSQTRLLTFEISRAFFFGSTLLTRRYRWPFSFKEAAYGSKCFTWEKRTAVDHEFATSLSLLATLRPG